MVHPEADFWIHSNMEFKNRRWYEWIMIILGVAGLIFQAIALFIPVPGPFSWAQFLVSAFFLWGGTVPRRKSNSAA